MSNIPLNIDWQQILLHFFNFSILVGGLYLLLFKPVKNFMDKREKHYADMESAAVAREKDTEALKAAMAQREAALDAELDEKRTAAAQEAENYMQQQRDAAKAQEDRGGGQPRGGGHCRGCHGEASDGTDRSIL